METTSSRLAKKNACLPGSKNYKNSSRTLCNIRTFQNQHYAYCSIPNKNNERTIWAFERFSELYSNTSNENDSWNAAPNLPNSLRTALSEIENPAQIENKQGGINSSTLPRVPCMHRMLLLFHPCTYWCQLLMRHISTAVFKIHEFQTLQGSHRCWYLRDCQGQSLHTPWLKSYFGRQKEYTTWNHSSHGFLCTKDKYNTPRSSDVKYLCRGSCAFSHIPLWNLRLQWIQNRFR